MTEAEKQELENQRMMKECALQIAMQQLEQLELERQQALEQYEVSRGDAALVVCWTEEG